MIQHLKKNEKRIVPTQIYKRNSVEKTTLSFPLNEAGKIPSIF